MADQPSTALPAAQYFNVLRITHTPREFFFDFGQGPTGEKNLLALVARLATSPAHAKEVAEALNKNIEKYEARFGPIREMQESTVQ